MPLLCKAPPKRPANIELISIGDLYQSFTDLFLAGGAVIESRCRHHIVVFKYHFFHLAGIQIGGMDERLFMLQEEAAIVGNKTDFGRFNLKDNGGRATHLPSALQTYQDPDAVVEDHPRADARWVYLKEYEGAPYRFSVAFVTDRPDEGGILVPTSSFRCDKSSAKKWLNGEGKLIYIKTAQPPL
jgi:hypothetical protein